MEPSLHGVVCGWGSDLEREHELYRNSLVYSTCLLSKQKFNDIVYKFTAKEDEDAEQPPIDL